MLSGTTITLKPLLIFVALNELDATVDSVKQCQIIQDLVYHCKNYFYLHNLDLWCYYVGLDQKTTIIILGGFKASRIITVITVIILEALRIITVITGNIILLFLKPCIF